MPTIQPSSAGRRRASLPLLATVPLAAVLAWAAVGAQQPAPPPTPAAPAQEPQAGQPRPTFRVEANFVRVDAIVTRDGTPVTDLTAADFEVLEDNVPQTLAAFERIDIATERLTTTPAREPNTAAEAREMARDPRARVFVLFLDRYHTGLAGSHRMKTALGTLLDRVIGPNDLVAVMTPDMSAADITFTRRTASINDMLERRWDWGVRDQSTALDPQEEQYMLCYPESDDPARGETPAGMTMQERQPAASVAREMIARRREKMTLDALTDLSLFLRGVREERKAVLVVSDGWALYRPNEQLNLLGAKGRVPGVGTPGTDPQGRVVPDARQQDVGGGNSRYRCDADRMRLSMLDNQQTYLDLMDEANRANVSFYPIDSRGLPVFDTSLAETFTDNRGYRGPMPIARDQQLLRNRIATLQTLAENTDGRAVVNSNDIEGGLARVVADLTSYYLLSYYSTNQALDGKFRRITVRVKRPGVEVRARRGYRAATPGEFAGETASAAPAAPTMPAATAAAFASLGSARADARLRTRAGVLVGERPRVWVVAELDAALARGADWGAGGRLQATLVTGDGSPVATAEGRIDSGGRVQQIELAPETLPPGEYQVRTRATPAAGGLPLADVAVVRVEASGAPGLAPRMSRRGPSTGLLYVPTADLRFRRTERARFEWSAAPGACVVGADVLDQRGQRMAVPVTRVLGGCEAADAAAGTVGAELTLAPFAAADYAVRVTVRSGGAEQELVAAFRLVP